MKKILSLMGALSLVLSTTVAVSCGEQATAFIEPDLPELRLITDHRDLGSFDHNPTDQELLDTFMELNPDLVRQELRIRHNGREGEVIISPKPASKVYKNGMELQVYYQGPTKNKHRLSWVLQNSYLGDFKTAPDNQEIMRLVKDFNQDLQLDQVALIYNADGKAVVSVVGKSTVYLQGNVNLTYGINQKFDLPSVINNPDLGIVSHQLSEFEALKLISEKNIWLDMDQIEITKITASTVTIKVKEDSTEYQQGEFEFTYQIGS